MDYQNGHQNCITIIDGKKEQMLKARAVFEKSIKCGFPFKDL